MLETHAQVLWQQGGERRRRQPRSAARG